MKRPGLGARDSGLVDGVAPSDSGESCLSNPEPLTPNPAFSIQRSPWRPEP